jgi:hypothetical protein
LGVIGDSLQIMGGGQATYMPQAMQQRQMQDMQRQKAFQDQEQMQAQRAEKQWEWANKPESKPQPTEFERILVASGLPPEKQIELMQQYAANRANPVQGVKTYDADGNETLQFIRPGQMQQQPQGRTFGGWDDEGGQTPPASGNFR